MIRLPRWRRRRNAPVTIWTLIRYRGDHLTAKLAESPREAFRWLSAAARLGIPSAQVNLGQMYVDAIGTRRDLAKALFWFRKAADSGSLDGINMVGRAHELGWSVPIDFAEAASWYEKAALQGHAWAQFNFAEMLRQGARGGDGLALALPWYVRAARQGNPKAMNMLGQYREGGVVIRRKPYAAFRWYARAADRGCFRGHYNLARLLAASGKIDLAARHVEQSIALAPADFCAAIAEQLAHHPAPPLRKAASLAGSKACGR